MTYRRESRFSFHVGSEILPFTPQRKENLLMIVTFKRSEARTAKRLDDRRICRRDDKKKEFSQGIVLSRNRPVHAEEETRLGIWHIIGYVLTTCPPIGLARV